MTRDAQLIAAISAGLSQVAAGTVNITPVANTPTSVAVTFPVGLFATAPTVVASPVTTVPGTTVTGVGVANVTTSGCNIYLTRTNTTATGVMWVAYLPNSGVSGGSSGVGGGTIDTSNFVTISEFDALQTDVANVESTVTSVQGQIVTLQNNIDTLAAEVAGADSSVRILDNQDGTDTITLSGTLTGVTVTDNGNGTSTVTTDNTILTVVDNGNGTSTATSTSTGITGGAISTGETITVDQAKNGGTWPLTRPTTDPTVTVVYTGWTDPFAAGIALAGDKWEITADLS